MPGKRASVKNEKQYEGLKKKGMSKQRAARIQLTGLLEPRRQEVRFLEQPLELEPGRHDRSEEGGRAQRRPRQRK